MRSQISTNGLNQAFFPLILFLAIFCQACFNASPPPQLLYARYTLGEGNVELGIALPANGPNNVPYYVMRKSSSTAYTQVAIIEDGAQSVYIDNLVDEVAAGQTNFTYKLMTITAVPSRVCSNNGCTSFNNFLYISSNEIALENRSQVEVTNLSFIDWGPYQDGVINPGEFLDFTTTLKNFDSLPATYVYTSCTIISGPATCWASINLSNLPAGESAWSPGLSFNIDPNAAPGSVVTYELRTNSNINGSYFTRHQTFSFVVQYHTSYQAKVEVTNLSFIDWGPYQDGVINPGEFLDFTTTLKNFDSLPATYVYTSCTIISGPATCWASINLSNLPAGESAWSPGLSFNIDPNAAPGSVVTYELRTNSNINGSYFTRHQTFSFVVQYHTSYQAKVEVTNLSFIDWGPYQDGVINPGEFLDFTTTLKNFDSLPATYVYTSCTIISGPATCWASINLSNLPAGESAWSPGLSFNIDPNAAPGSVVTYELRTNSNINGSYFTRHQTFSFVVQYHTSYQAKVEVTNLSFIDWGPYQDGVINPGEFLDFTTTLKNFDSLPATYVYTSCTIISGPATCWASINLSNLPAGESAWSPGLSFNIDPNAAPGSVVTYELRTNSNINGSYFTRHQTFSFVVQYHTSYQAKVEVTNLSFIDWGPYQDGVINPGEFLDFTTTLKNFDSLPATYVYTSCTIISGPATCWASINLSNLPAGESAWSPGLSFNIDPNAAPGSVVTYELRTNSNINGSYFTRHQTFSFTVQ